MKTRSSKFIVEKYVAKTKEFVEKHVAQAELNKEVKTGFTDAKKQKIKRTFSQMEECASSIQQLSSPMPMAT